MAIDTHAHIFDEQFNEDRQEVINRLIEAKIEKLVLVGFSKETNVLAQNIASRYDFIYPTAGYHPSEANEINEADIRDAHSLTVEVVESSPSPIDSAQIHDD